MRILHTDPEIRAANARIAEAEASLQEAQAAHTAALEAEHAAGDQAQRVATSHALGEATDADVKAARRAMAEQREKREAAALKVEGYLGALRELRRRQKQAVATVREREGAAHAEIITTLLRRRQSLMLQLLAADHELQRAQYAALSQGLEVPHANSRGAAIGRVKIEDHGYRKRPDEASWCLTNERMPRDWIELSEKLGLDVPKRLTELVTQHAAEAA